MSDTWELSLHQAKTSAILDQVGREVNINQVGKWGIQHHPLGLDRKYALHAELAKEACARAVKAGTITWHQILEEEYYEALCEEGHPKAAREELIQTAAVIVSMIADLDSKEHN